MVIKSVVLTPVSSDPRLKLFAVIIGTTVSILTTFPAVVEEIVPEGRAQVMVRVKMNGVVLLACLTNKSASILQLENGLSVFVQVKSVAILS